MGDIGRTRVRSIVKFRESWGWRWNMSSDIHDDPLAMAAEAMQAADAPATTLRVQEHELHVQRAQAYALMDVAGSLRKIAGLLEAKPTPG
jgi:hypothetical protein